MNANRITIASLGVSKAWIKWFWSRATRHPNSCLIWDGLVDREGYGQIDINGKRQIAHRIAFVLKHGSIAKGQVVRHIQTCRSRTCIDPAHLLDGTQADNMKDKAGISIYHCSFCGVAGHIRSNKTYHP